MSHCARLLINLTRITNVYWAQIFFTQICSRVTVLSKLCEFIHPMSILTILPGPLINETRIENAMRSRWKLFAEDALQRRNVRRREQLEEPFLYISKMPCLTNQGLPTRDHMETDHLHISMY